MIKYRVYAVAVLLIGGLLAYFVWATQIKNPASQYRFKLGLDLAGGTELVYKADTSNTPKGDRAEALTALQGVIERRVNLFGVSEPIVHTEERSALSGISEDRLIVELPGVTDVKKAIDELGKTPTLDFKLVSLVPTNTGKVSESGTLEMSLEESYIDTGLTGQYLSSAALDFGSGGPAGFSSPSIILNFNADGAKLFEKITRENVGKQLAIFLDNKLQSAPTIQEVIPGGTATITGKFSAVEARDQVRNLNLGALPVSISLDSTSSIGPTLGEAAITAGVKSGMIGFAIIALFMILWYRLPGLIAAIALAEYLVFMLAVIKFIPITLTASGIAGLIITLGMAVDANVLIFERMKEELRDGKSPREAVHLGFARAWTAIRDGHFTMIISGIILFWLGTSIVKGFALVFVLGVIASFISAVSISRILLLALVPENKTGAWKFLLGSVPTKL